MSNIVAILGFFAALMVCVAQAFTLQDPSAAAVGAGKGLGQCNKNMVKTMPNFDLRKYRGMWYEHAKIPIITEAFMKCCQTNVTYDDATQACNMTDKGFRWGRYVSGGVEKVTQPDLNEPAQLSTRFYGPISPVGNYWILDTDYTNYAVVYTCLDLKIFSTDYAWILMRKQGAPDNAFLDKAKRTLVQNGIDILKLKPTDQTSCPPLPSDF